MSDLTKIEQLLQDLAAAQSPAQQAAIIAESAFAQLDEQTAQIARRCVILRWFDAAILVAMLPAELEEAARNLQAEAIYNMLASLPFVETASDGRLIYHDQTRQGLIERLAAQPEMLHASASLVVNAYLAYGDTTLGEPEALYCLLIADRQSEASELLDRLLIARAERDDWQGMLALFQIFDNATYLTFVSSPQFSALHYFARALAFQELGQHQSAIEDYDQAILLKPDYADAYSNLATTLRVLERWHKAASALQRANELDDSDWTVWVGLADVARRQGDESAWRAAIEKARPSVDYNDIYNAACFESVAGNVDRALELLERAILEADAGKAWAKQDPDLHWIRHEPRFWAIVGEKD